MTNKYILGEVLNAHPLVLVSTISYDKVISTIVENGAHEVKSSAHLACPTN